MKGFRRLHLLAVALVAIAGVAVGGCAGSSVFSPYPLQAQAFRNAAGGLDSAAVLAKLDQKRNSADRLLYLLERGRLAQLQGDFEGSRADFDAAIAVFRAHEDKPMLSLGAAGASGSAMLTNDNALPYRGYGYERVMLHQFQAINYLALAQVEGATVELRRAAQVQRELELKYADEIAKVQGDAVQNRVLLGEFDNQFAGMDVIAGQAKNSFQNGYTFYTSAVIWEALGEYNNALVDYKKALELAPANSALRDDVIRTNEYFDGRPAARRDTARNTGKAAAPAGTVVVLFEQGFVPARKPVGLGIPTTDGGMFSIQFPVYDRYDYQPPTALSVRSDTGATGASTLLVDTSVLAVKALREQVPAMLLRQVLRARAKYEMQKQALDKGGLGGQFLANIYNLVSEQADLRNWLTLPANAQGLRLSLPAGSRSLEVASVTGSLSLPVEVRAGRTTLVRVVEVNGRLLARSFAL